ATASSRPSSTATTPSGSCTCSCPSGCRDERDRFVSFARGGLAAAVAGLGCVHAAGTARGRRVPEPRRGGGRVPAGGVGAGRTQRGRQDQPAGGGRLPGDPWLAPRRPGRGPDPRRGGVGGGPGRRPACPPGGD